MFFSLKFIKDDHFETKGIEVGNSDELLTISSEILSCAFNEICFFYLQMELWLMKMII